jgi:imidazoleglycerol phosphate synthase glutamine amidotransferase subunit HisH
VGRFMGELRVPHLGWNRISPSTGCRVIEEGYAYFANSYRVLTAPHGWSVATAEYGGRFAAALERGNVIACQFHPELSGEFGLRLIRRWIQGDRGKEGASC